MELIKVSLLLFVLFTVAGLSLESGLEVGQLAEVLDGEDVAEVGVSGDLVQLLSGHGVTHTHCEQLDTLLAGRGGHGLSAEMRKEMDFIIFLC
jgi:hypothetical protein